MKMLHTAYRVSDVKRSVDFYARVGFREIGRIVFEDGSMLLMLNLSGDGEVVTLELAYHPKLDSLEIGKGFSHIVVQVDRLDAMRWRSSPREASPSTRCKLPPAIMDRRHPLFTFRTATASSSWSGRRVTPTVSPAQTSSKRFLIRGWTATQTRLPR
jgi:hypothetical protein